jgi:hypothetical protein
MPVKLRAEAPFSTATAGVEAKTGGTHEGLEGRSGRAAVHICPATAIARLFHGNGLPVMPEKVQGAILAIIQMALPAQSLMPESITPARFSRLALRTTRQQSSSLVIDLHFRVYLNLCNSHFSAPSGNFHSLFWGEILLGKPCRKTSASLQVPETVIFASLLQSVHMA